MTNTKQKVYKTKLKFTYKLCLQNKTNVYIQVMFTKQVMYRKQNTYNVAMGLCARWG